MKRIIIVIVVGIALQVGVCFLSGLMIDNRRVFFPANIRVHKEEWEVGREIELFESLAATRADIHYNIFSGSPADIDIDFLIGDKLYWNIVPKPHREVLEGVESHAWQQHCEGGPPTDTVYVAYGYPFRATYGAVDADMHTGFYKPLKTALLINTSDGVSEPLRIICWGIYWRGFLGNSAIYALVIGLPYFGYRKVRRIVWLRRGGCPACGYDLRGSGEEAGCPECGWGRL